MRLLAAVEASDSGGVAELLLPLVLPCAALTLTLSLSSGDRPRSSRGFAKLTLNLLLDGLLEILGVHGGNRRRLLLELESHLRPLRREHDLIEVLRPLDGDLGEDLVSQAGNEESPSVVPGDPRDDLVALKDHRVDRRPSGELLGHVLQELGVVEGEPVEVLRDRLLSPLLEGFEKIDLLDSRLFGRKLVQERLPEVLPLLELAGNAAPHEGRGLRDELNTSRFDPFVFLISGGLEGGLDEENPVVRVEDLRALLPVATHVLRADLQPGVVRQGHARVQLHSWRVRGSHVAWIVSRIRTWHCTRSCTLSCACTRTSVHGTCTSVHGLGLAVLTDRRE